MKKVRVRRADSALFALYDGLLLTWVLSLPLVKVNSHNYSKPLMTKVSAGAYFTDQ